MAVAATGGDGVVGGAVVMGDEGAASGDGLRERDGATVVMERCATGSPVMVIEVESAVGGDDGGAEVVVRGVGGSSNGGGAAVMDVVVILMGLVTMEAVVGGGDGDGDAVVMGDGGCGGGDGRWRGGWW
ncbi:hypothetical protein F0562_006184 [Nyssa sinensis]|uniref:Uncharacterized protein n=1 Tax=Nyssa sinensis TaxID=561372 RepID=A0A5J5AK91_9ASTE|nr:hypothetical protein F0562_006184 [Nyssa sinensis]